MTNAETNKRLFVGNLFPDVASKDLEKLFGRFGSVTNVEIKNKTDIDGKIISTFAFINANMTEESLPKCIQTLNGLKWKKQNLKVQAAQESFMQRLQRERQERLQKFDGQQQQHQEEKTTQQQQQDKTTQQPKQDDKNPNYDPMSMFKKVVKNEEPNEKKPAKASVKEDRAKNLVDQESMFIQSYKENVDETVPGVGKAKNGLVTFSDDEDDNNRTDRGEGRSSLVKSQKIKQPKGTMSNSKRKYHSSSEDEDEEGTSQSVPLIPRPTQKKIEKPNQASKPKPLARKRYYSNSDEESDDAEESKVPTDQGLKFGGDFWGDSDDEEQSNRQNHPSKKSFEQNFNKHPNVKDANSKRLQSIKQRQKELQKSQKMLGKIKVDGQAQAKKIRFDDNNVKNDNKAKLFQESDDSDDEDHFKVKEQFEGKSGEKLLELQSRIAATDDRFKVDARFKESDSSSDESESENKNDKEKDDIDIDIQKEKQRNLELLQAVIGDKSTTSEKKKPRGVEFKDTSKLRFDPDDEALAKKFEKGQESDSDSSEKSEIQPLPTETPMPEVSQEKSYYLKKDTFSKTEPKSGFSFGFNGEEAGQSSQGFSLLKKFGREPYEAEEVNKKDKKGKLGFLERNPFKYDSSSEDEDEEKPKESKNFKTALPSQADQMAEFSRKLAQKSISISSKLTEPFLFKVNDPRLIEGAEFLSHDKESLDETRAKYEEQRPILAKIIKKKRRNRVQKQNQMTMKAKKGRKAVWQKKQKMKQSL